MSALETKLTAEERDKIETQSTQYKNETVHDPLTQKLLLCLLESVQDLTAEVKTLRKQNETLQDILQSVTTTHGQGYAIKVHKV